MDEIDKKLTRFSRFFMENVERKRTRHRRLHKNEKKNSGIWINNRKLQAGRT